MRFRFLIAVFSLSTTLPAQAQTVDATCHASLRARALCTTDSLLAEATRHNDAATLSRIYAADYHFTTVRGTTAGRGDQLRAFQTGEMHFDSATVSQRRLRIYGCAAVVTGRRDQLATVRGEARPSAVRFTHTYIWEGGRWQLVASQNTPILASNGRE